MNAEMDILDLANSMEGIVLVSLIKPMFTHNDKNIPISRSHH